MANYITPSLKRAIRGKTLKPITEDYTMKEVDRALTSLLGSPGRNAGRAQRQMESGMAARSSGVGYSAPLAADQPVTTSSIGSSTASGAVTGGAAGAAIGFGLGMVDTLVNYFISQHNAKQAYERQNEFYNNHLSMPAKVEEYEEAGLNPMGLAGSGAGATSAPAVQPAETPESSGLVNLLGSLLSYKAQMARVEVDRQRVDVERESVASQIALREERRITQEKINAWYDTNQVANLDKIESETARNLEIARTEQEKQALIFNQAVAQEIKNKYADTWERNALDLQQAELRYKESATAENYAAVRVANQRVQNMVLDAAYTVSKTENMQVCTSYLGIKTDMLQFDKEHQRADKIWQRIGQTISGIEGVTRSAANVFSCFTHIPTPVQPSRSPSLQPGSSSRAMFDEYDTYHGIMD